MTETKDIDWENEWEEYQTQRKSRLNKESKLDNIVNNYLDTFGNDIKVLSTTTLRNFKQYLNKNNIKLNLTPENKQKIGDLIDERIKYIRKRNAEYYLGTGNKFPTSLRRNIYSFRDECEMATEDGKKCGQGFNYTTTDDKKLNCTKFCMKNCEQWVNDV